MRLSYEQAQRLNIPWPDDLPKDSGLSRGGRQRGSAVAEPRATRSRTVRVNDKGMNKTEAAFDVHLDTVERAGLILARKFEPFKWRLAGKTWLKLDFAVWLPDRRLIGVDVKEIGRASCRERV